RWCGPSLVGEQLVALVDRRLEGLLRRLVARDRRGELLVDDRGHRVGDLDRLQHARRRQVAERDLLGLALRRAVALGEPGVVLRRRRGREDARHLPRELLLLGRAGDEARQGVRGGRVRRPARDRDALHVQRRLPDVRRRRDLALERRVVLHGGGDEVAAARAQI